MITNTCTLTKLEEKTSYEKQSKWKPHTLEEKTLNKKQLTWKPHTKEENTSGKKTMRCKSQNSLSPPKKRLTNTSTPSWLVRELDLSRDRVIKPKKKGKGGQHCGNARKHAYNQKQERLTLQSGTESIVDHMSDFVSYVKLIDCKFYQQTINVLEMLILFIYDLFRSRNFMDIIVSCAHMVKHYTRANILTQEHLNNLKELLSFTNLQSCERKTIDSFRDILRDWKRIRKSPLIQKMTKVLLYMTTIGFYKGPLPKEVAERVGEVATDYTTHRMEFASDFIYYILDLLHFVCDKTYSVIFEGRNPKDFLVSNIEYDTWLIKAQEHLAKSGFLSNPSAYDIDLHQYLYELKELISAGISMYKYSCELDKLLRNLIRKTTFELQKVEMRMLSRESAQSMRQVPFAIAIEGPSAVGKSKVAEAIHVYFANLFNKPITGCERYVKSATAKFWDGFTSDMWSLFIDDAGMWSSELDLIDESIMDIVRIVNNMPYMPDMAALEDKGKTPFKGDLVVITTNCPDLKCNEYFSYPFAAARRVPWHIRVRAKHVDESQFMLKTNAEDLIANQIPDDWIFDILTPVPKKFGNKQSEGLPMMQGQLKAIHTGLSMRELLLFIKEKATLHRNHQNCVVQHSASLVKLELCDECKLPPNFCQCVKNQGGVEIIAMTAIQYFCNYFITRLLDMLIFYNILPTLCNKIYSKYHNFFILRLRELQDKAQNKFNNIHSRLRPIGVFTVSLCTVVGVLLTLYKLFLSIKKQGSKVSTWGMSYPDLNERENVWQKDPYVIDTFDSTPQSLSMGGLDEEKCKDLLSKSCAYLRFLDGETWKFCRLLNLKGQKFLVPNHCIPKNKSIHCQIIRGYLNDKKGDHHFFNLNQSQIMRLPDVDLCLLTIPSVSNGKDITNLFIKEKAINKGPMQMIMRNKDGSISHLNKNFTFCEELQNMPLCGIKYKVWKTPDLITNNGDCGALVYRLDDMGLRILGIHESYQTNMLSSNYACSVLLTHEFIQSLPLDNEIGIVEPQLGQFAEKVDLRPVSESSCLRSIAEGTISVYGNINHINRPRSKVKQSMLCRSMMDLGFELKYGPPVMDTLTPWCVNIKKQVQADNYIEWDDLMLIKNQILEQWKFAVPEFEKEVKILDFDTTINGKPGVKYIDAIPRKTSAGFPFCKSKTYYMEPLEDESGLDKVIFTPQIMDKVLWRLEEYKNGNRSKPVFRAALKDEAVSLEKISTSKTRVFMGAPVDFTICMRSLLLSFVRIVQKNKFIFESAPGTEAQCIEWDMLYRYLTELGEDNMIFGDFSGFDASMRSNVMRVAFDLIEDFHRMSGASEEHCKMIRALSYDVVFPLVEFNGDLIELNGKNPSGQPLTVILNGLVNCICVRYCYLKLNPDREVNSFRDNVRLMTYGDDNGMGVSKSVPWFNHTAISKVMSTIGMKYTMADKASESQPYIHISQADFLKRKWAYCEDTESMVCPLSEDSIIKSLMIGVKSKNISEQEHAANVIYSAHLEFFWHGKSKFDKWSKLFQVFITDFDLEPYLPKPLPSWDELVFDYNFRSKTFLQLQVGEETRLCVHCYMPKSLGKYDVCNHCKLKDQCMICDGITEDICLNIDPPLWFCRECDYTMFWDLLYPEYLMIDLLNNAYSSKMEIEGTLDLSINGFDHTSILESATVLDWDGRFYVSVPSATNDRLLDELGHSSRTNL
jgi:hypothetical protein